MCLVAGAPWKAVGDEQAGKLHSGTQDTGLNQDKPARVEDIVFKSTLDGSDQRYVLVLPEGFDPQASVSVLIALHGHGSDRWQFVKDGRDECRAARDAAAKYRMIYVSPDYRARTSWMGPAAQADMLQIIEDLRRRYRVGKVVISGGSMGGTAALTFAVLHPDRIDGVVSLNGTANLVEYTQFQDAISASFGGTKQEKPDEYRKRSAELNAEKLKMPIALTTGGRDTLVPPDSVLRLAESLQKLNRKVRLIHRPAGGHSTDYADSTAAYEFVLNEVVGPEALGPAKALLNSNKPSTIVCLGDSVTGVYYHTGGRRAYPEMLEIAIKKAMPTAEVTVINAGISGQTTADGLARLDRDVLSHRPDVVTISFGLNDMGRLSEEQYRTNLEALVTRCRAAQAAVVLCTPNSVLTTAARPIEKLKRYCDVVHAVAKSYQVPVCDQFAAGEALRAKDAWEFRCLLSDEIHPNMAGHKRMAEELCRTIVGVNASLRDVGPLLPALVRTRALVESAKPVKVLAMPPYDTLIAGVLTKQAPGAVVELTSWPTEGKSLLELEQAANRLVRTMKPDLVILAVPATATAGTDEEFFRSYSWIMNWSLSFGHQEWDCLVVHPSVANPEVAGLRADLIRQLIRSQDLPFIDRSVGDLTESSSLFAKGVMRTW